MRLRNGAVLDRESNPRINTRVIARDNPLGPASNQNQRAASVRTCLYSVVIKKKRYQLLSLAYPV